ncbi:type I polyketide synthase [Acetivibrio cellulolyticus]|uniref:type I polyketide synthase n=1 Tax=Acetivibrio cellulolyticus TaxID=35830 RepID=UPI0001E300D2|nr:type I polyketide synthase [Acetivibrio cellulolyticus]
MSNYQDSNYEGAIAIIGMNGRFPGAKDMEEFWDNLYNGVESVKFFSREELLKMGIDEHLLDNPRFVAADAILDDMDKFDASFFDYSAREAEIMDPQHRLFLESAWEVLESAGYNSELYDGRIAVYAGANLSGYMIRNLYSNPELVENLGSFKIMIANSQDFLATRVSYKMNLTGPSVNVNTLCSSSMVALQLACQNLQNYGCDVALAGGVSFQISRNEVFFYQEGGIGSADGHCRAFDSKANGTVSGSGLAVLVLKRLEDAIEDGDHIHAVIRGIGVNNDGSEKNSFTAPNVEGQAECIAEAIEMSGVDPETISYIDAHGTGTDLGDPIEISALTKAFRAHTKKKQFCAIGSVKTNIGHLVTAGGLASLVKTVLAMKHRVIPPSLNFEEANPKIDFLNSPFYVNTKLSRWETDGYPLRAGISSFGIGGTNTHVIIEEPPKAKASEESARPWQLITFSAKTAAALKKMTEDLAQHIRKNPDVNLADIAFTLKVGRRNFNHRRMVVCKDTKDLLSKLESLNGEQVFSRFQKPREQPVVFMFPGEESQYVNMGRELYETEPAFSNAVDRCAKILEPLMGLDIRKVLYPDDQKMEYAVSKMKEEAIARTAVFVVEYAMANLWIEWEIEPACMIGKGSGEYAAACIAGVFSLEDALLLVSASEEELQQKLSNISLNSVKIPFISCITGSWIKDHEASDRNYWIRQRRANLFEAGLKEVQKDPDQILIEMGPGCELYKMAVGNAMTIDAGEQDTKRTILCTLPDVEDKEQDGYLLLNSLGHYWLAGNRVNWNKLYKYEARHRIPLPTYPFERQRYWIEPGKRNAVDNQPKVLISGSQEITDSITSSKFEEGVITITLKQSIGSGEPDSNGEVKQQLENILKFKDDLEKFCEGNEHIKGKVEISPLGLKSLQTDGQSGVGGSEQLKKRPRPDLQSAYVAPRNEVEKTIVECWQNVLGFDMIGIHDDFFELGGHSLIAAAVASELGKVLDVQIPLRKLMETTTAEGVANLIETYRWVSQGTDDAKVNEEEIEECTV